MRGVSEFVLVLLFMIIVLFSITVLWLYYYGYFRHITFSGESPRLGEALSSCMKIDSASNNKIYLKNCGSGVVKSDKINVFIDEEPFEFTMSPNSISKGEIAEITIKNLLGISFGEHKIKITSPSGKTERYLKAVPHESCILALDFDEGSGDIAYDKSGYGNNGVLVNNPIWVNGKYGKALEFDEDGKWVDVPLEPPNQGTIELWFKPNWNGNDGKIHALIDASTPPPLPTGEKNFNIEKSDIDNTLRSDIENSSDDDFVLSYDVTTYITSGNWYYIVATWRYDDTGTVLYLDENKVAEETWFLGTKPTLNNFYIGDNRTYYGTAGFADGTIDSVRIYNKALTPDETVILNLGELA